MTKRKTAPKKATSKRKAAKRPRTTKPVSKTTYTEKVAERICELIADGEPLRAICRRPKMPAWRTVYKWLEEQATFASKFAHARKIGFDAIAEECLEIANKPLIFEEVTVIKDGQKTTRKTTRKEALEHRKLQIETRLKLLAKWDPKRYGELIKLGGDGANNPILTGITVAFK